MPSITVYSTPTCPFCRMAKEYLTQRGVAFTDVDVSADPAKAEEMIAKTGQLAVPVIDVDGRIIVGFDRTQLDAALKGKG